MTLEQKLQRCLDDLLGFAERNVKRAEVALENAHLDYAGDGYLKIQEARLHEAQRFLLVVRDRIAEARHG